MKTRFFAVALIASLFSSALLAQEVKPSSNIGLSFEAGFSHLFLGDPLSNYKPDAIPGSGAGGGAALFYELQYKHFLFRTGFGMDYSLNTNRLVVPDYSSSIAEYQSMTLHYRFDRFKETTTYGVGYVPVYFGGIWNKFFFLAGAKIGVVPFGTATRSATDVTIWAEDADVIDPMYDLPTHDLTQFSYKGNRTAYSCNPVNAMLSLELGINLDKRQWADDKTIKKMDREARYRELHRRRTFKEMLHYRLSFFADYGLMDIRKYSANPVPYGAEAAEGGLVAFNSTSDLTPHTMLGYAPLQDSKLSNFLFGVKFAIMYEIPKKAPKKGSMANPFLYACVLDELTAKPLGNARVLMQNTKQPKQKLDRVTDTKLGRVGKAMPVGEYKITASHSGYYPDSLLFNHEDRYDTVYISLYPQQTLDVITTDAKTGRPIGAEITLYDVETGELVNSAQVDSAANKLSTVLDGRKRYLACAEARGYISRCDTVVDVREITNLQLEPKILRKFILHNMFFATDKTKILPTSEAALQELYKLLSENPEMRIKIIGHTDDVASDQYNKKLSEGRARSVRKEMIDRGIDGKRIETEGHGEKDPIVENDSDEHRQMNRRVEIEILSGVAQDHVITNEQLKR